MRSVFVPVELAEAEKAIAMYDLAKFGAELIPIPAMGGCVIAIREIQIERGGRPMRFHLPWVEKIHDFRTELRVRSLLRTAFSSAEW